MIFLIILSDEEFQRLKKRDPLIYGRIYKEYKDKIFSFIMIKTNSNYELAEEIFSDTFHSALMFLPKLKSQKNIIGWLYQIAHSRFVDKVRKYNREKKYNTLLHTNFPQKTDIFENIDRNEKVLIMKSAMENIKTEYKTILTMKYIERKKAREIAAALGKHLKAVESLLYRAKKALKKEMEALSDAYF